MSRKGREPPGLRRWRLAHKKKRRVRRLKVVRRVARRRYGRKRKGGKSKAIPLAIVLPVAAQAYSSFTAYANPVSKMHDFVTKTSGYDIAGRKFDAGQAMPFWLGMIAGVVVHKVANKTVNRHIRKLTFGYLTL